MPPFSSAEIDRQVRELAAAAVALDALGVYEVRTNVLQELRPTHIITQSQCDVCAVSERDVVRAVAMLTTCEPEIVSLEPYALADVWTDVMRVASSLGVESRGTQLVQSMQARMTAIEDAAKRLDRRPSLALIEWTDPIMTGGNWMPELVSMAGARSRFGEPGVHSPYIEFDELLAADPEIILIAPCGFGIERTSKELGPLVGARRVGVSASGS